MVTLCQEAFASTPFMRCLRVVFIREIDARRGDVEALLAVTGDGVGEVDDVHDLGAAEAGDSHSTHAVEAASRVAPASAGRSTQGRAVPVGRGVKEQVADSRR